MYLIYGKGRVGNAIAALCRAQNLDFQIADDADDISDFSSFEAIIPSPGIPGTHRIYSTGKVISELDFAYQFLPENFQIVTITGTDGKSTTTWMAFSILQKYFFGKKKIYLSGNFEIPFSETIVEILQDNEKEGIIVLEASSFMLHWIGKTLQKPFKSDFSIFTNLKTDHLNWHRDLQEYSDAKMNLIKNTSKRAVINQEVYDFIKNKNLNSMIFPNTEIFSDSKKTESSTDGEKIFVKDFGKISLSETHFSGRHNAMNLLSVLLVLREMNLDFEKIAPILWEISGLPHRLELIDEIHGIKIVEDSKSTSAQSLAAALHSHGNSKNMLLIAGGSDKGDDFSELGSLFARRVKKIACIGATKKLFSDLAKQNNIEFLETDSLSDATNWLFDFWEKDDVLMLSPGCASFGLFQDYLDRANQFRLAVANLKNGQ